MPLPGEVTRLPRCKAHTGAEGPGARREPPRRATRHEDAAGWGRRPRSRARRTARLGFRGVTSRIALLTLVAACAAAGCVTTYGEAAAEAALPDDWGLAGLRPAPGSESERAAAAFPLPAALLRPDQWIFTWPDHQQRVVQALRDGAYFTAVELAACKECRPEAPATRLAAALAAARGAPLLCAEDRDHTYGLLFCFDDDWTCMTRIGQRAYRHATADALAQLTERLQALAPIAGR